jgi:flagellar biosynthesis/type III secretory pathway protein FliH
MADDFVPLAVFLRPATPAVAPEPAVACVPLLPEECAEAIRAARRFRAALADVLDVTVGRLLREIAHGVFARELRIEPANVVALVTDALDRFGNERALSIRAHPDDLDALADFEIGSVGDNALQRGDLIFELHSGTIDLRMPARLDAALAACAS